MGMAPKGKESDEEMEKFERAKKMAQVVAVGDPITGVLKAAGAYTTGVLNAVGSNSLLGAGRQDPSTFGEYPPLAQAGQATGDLLSVVQGLVEMVVGGGGTAVATSTGVGVVATPATVGVAVHGASTTGTAMSNFNPLSYGTNGYAKRSTHAENMLPSGKVGSLVVRDFQSNKLVTVSKGKLTATECERYWNNPELIVGSIVT